MVFGIESAICFSYNWGKPLHSASTRLFAWLDTFVAFGSAWALTAAGRALPVWVGALGRRSAAPVTGLACAALFAMHIATANEARFINALILTRDSAQVWRFFERLGEKRILVLSDRPGLFTIMDYGALDISAVSGDHGPLNELSRHLYQAISSGPRGRLANRRSQTALCALAGR